MKNELRPVKRESFHVALNISKPQRPTFNNSGDLTPGRFSRLFNLLLASHFADIRTSEQRLTFIVTRKDDGRRQNGPKRQMAWSVGFELLLVHHVVK